MKNINANRLLAAILGCTTLELNIFDKCKYRFEDVVNDCKYNIGAITFPNLFYAVIERGLGDLQMEIDVKFAEMKANDDVPDELKGVTLNINDDVGYYCSEEYGCLVSFKNNNNALYYLYFKDELDNFERNTGFSIEPVNIDNFPLYKVH